MDKKKKQILILVAIASLITLSGIALAQTGWFKFVYQPDLTTPGLKLGNPFTLSYVPEYFQISVTLTGSGNMGQDHEIAINIDHDRIDGGLWKATADYVLALEANGTSLETIYAGTFTNLRENTPHVKSLTWAPSTSPSDYQMVLNIAEVSWALVPEYTITATAGTGGSISPSGQVQVLEGESQTFTITTETGYTFDKFLIDTVPILVLGDTFTFDNVTADHSIHANFASTMITMNGNAYNFTDENGHFSEYIPDFDGLKINQYIAGVEEIQVSWQIEYSGFDVGVINSITFSLDYMYVNGTVLVPIESNNTVSCAIVYGGFYTFHNQFMAPSIPNEEYTVSMQIKSVT